MEGGGQVACLLILETFRYPDEPSRRKQVTISYRKVLLGFFVLLVSSVIAVIPFAF